MDTFCWLSTPDKYFLLVDKKAHGEESTRTFFQYVYVLEDSQDIEISQGWLCSNYRALLVGFAQVYLADQESARPYLTAGTPNTLERALFDAPSAIAARSEHVALIG